MNELGKKFEEIRKMLRSFTSPFASPRFLINEWYATLSKCPDLVTTKLINSRQDEVKLNETGTYPCQYLTVLYGIIDECKYDVYTTEQITKRNQKGVVLLPRQEIFYDIVVKDATYANLQVENMRSGESKKIEMEHSLEDNTFTFSDFTADNPLFQCYRICIYTDGFVTYKSSTICNNDKYKLFHGSL